MGEFNLEERQLIHLYNAPERALAIYGMKTSLPHVFDPDMVETMRELIGKLENISDGEYAELFSHPYENWNETEV